MRGAGGYRFQFSVVMSVYDVEPYLREAVESVFAQDVGFQENVQLILVDDGSADGSWKLCEEYRDRYSDNIVAVHQMNQGLSSARNEGLRHVEGRLVNFLDPDDRLTENTLSAVWKFFEAHWEETDAVAIPMYYFEDKTGPHTLNYKFQKGSRVINLRQEYSMVQLSMASAFLKEEVLRDVEFDRELHDAEDAGLLLKILGRKFTLGVVANCRYEYRKRRRQDSRTQITLQQKEGYCTCLEHFSLGIMQYYQDLLGYVPRFVQYTVMYHLQWRLTQEELPAGLLSPEESREYLRLLHETFLKIDDQVILEQKSIYAEHRLFVFRNKYGSVAELFRFGDQAELYFGNTRLCNLSQNTTRFEFLSLENGEAVIEGTTSLVDGLTEELAIQARVGDRVYPCRRIEKNDREIKILGEKALEKYAFEIRIPWKNVLRSVKIQIELVWDGKVLRKSAYQYGKFFPVGTECPRSYYAKDGKMFFVWKNQLYLAPCGKGKHLRKEAGFLVGLLRSPKPGFRKAAVSRMAARFLKLFRRRPVWLISDRVEKADDNGEAFFEYVLREHRKDIKAYFVLERSSPHYDRLRRLGPVLEPGSSLYKLIHLQADVLVSSQGEGTIRNPFGAQMPPYRDILNAQSYIFLQHGVTKDDLSGWLNRSEKNITGFVTTARAEWDSVVNGNYGYPEKNIWLTGLPRFDKLYHDEKKCVTVMPTWRKYLLQSFDPEKQEWQCRSDFGKSEFFLFYQGLLKSERLLSAAEKLGYRVQFMPHPNMRCCIGLFDLDSRVRVLSASDTYRRVYAESDLLFTDYSSTVFDFVYLKKPVVYGQFDRDNFFKGAHSYTKGYFDYEREGFGEVEYDLDSTVERLIEYMENGCQMKEKYRERTEKFFAYQDQENCSRVYDKIRELSRK